MQIRCVFCWVSANAIKVRDFVNPDMAFVRCRKSNLRESGHKYGHKKENIILFNKINILI